MQRSLGTTDLPDVAGGPPAELEPLGPSKVVPALGGRTLARSSKTRKSSGRLAPCCASARAQARSSLGNKSAKSRRASLPSRAGSGPGSRTRTHQGASTRACLSTCWAWLSLWRGGIGDEHNADCLRTPFDSKTTPATSHHECEPYILSEEPTWLEPIGYGKEGGRETREERNNKHYCNVFFV